MTCSSREAKRERELELSSMNHEIESEICEISVDPVKVANGEVDDDGRSRRTGIDSVYSLSTLLI